MVLSDGSNSRRPYPDNHRNTSGQRPTGLSWFVASRGAASIGRGVGGVRWKVDVTTGQILGTEVRSERSHALAVSDAAAPRASSKDHRTA